MARMSEIECRERSGLGTRKRAHSVNAGGIWALFNPYWHKNAQAQIQRLDKILVEQGC